ncbi:MAG: PKD domain-containing protein, partial [Thiohalomonadales bacterium]
DKLGSYVLTLTVNDGTSDSTNSALVKITATVKNVAPVAVVGPDQNVTTLSQVTLNGSASSDGNGDAITYKWNITTKPSDTSKALPNGSSNAQLSDDTAVKPTFVADVDGTYVISLVVSDGILESTPGTKDSTVTITASKGNSAPIADAGPDQSRIVNDFVTLDGSRSSDADKDPISYAWTIKSVPSGSASGGASILTALTYPNTISPTFTADVIGAYVFSLVVYDGNKYSNNNNADVIINVAINAPPIADAGLAQLVTTGGLVTVDGGASSDANGDSLSYTWSIKSVPATSAVTIDSLSGITFRAPSFIADVDGDYVLSLLVHDGSQFSVLAAQVTITAKPPNRAPSANAGPTQTVDTGTTVRLDGSASSDLDGDLLTYVWRISSAPAGSKSTLTNPLTDSPTFITDVDGTYTFNLAVNDGLLNSTISTVTINAVPINRAPFAVIVAPTAAVSTGDLVQLDGSSSSDPDQNTINFNWSISAPTGSSILSLSSSTAKMPTFTPDVAGDYTISLVVNDGLLDSVQNSVIVNVKKANLPPTANAGTNQLVVANGTLVTLNGSGTDPDGNPLTYQWTVDSSPIAASTPILSNANIAMPTFTPTATIAGSYSFSLIVNDGTVNSAASPVIITVTDPNQAPTADAGLNQTVNNGSVVTLNGTGSSDPEQNTLTYLWSMTSMPAGVINAPILSSLTSATPTFTPVLNISGIYTLSLIVNDGKLDSPPSNINITVNVNGIPVANAGIDQAVSPGSLVTLDGSLSKDPDGTALTTLWSLASPVGAAITLSSNTASRPTFTAPTTAGDYTFSLIVNDGALSSTADLVIISVIAPNQPPVANAGNTQIASVGDTVTLNGSGSTDPDPADTTLNYRWTVLSKPQSSNLATLLASTSSTPTFIPDVVGNYAFSLIVNDGKVDSLVAATVSIVVGLASEGTSAAPMNISFATASLPNNRSVDTTDSYYIVTGLTSNASYQISITGLSDDADLYVYNDATYTAPADPASLFYCDSRNSGTNNDACSASTDTTATVLYIRVSGTYTNSGTTFSLNVSLSKAEGSITQPVALTAGTSTPYAGQVDKGSSYYTIDGLNNSGSYVVSLSGLSDDVDLFVYSDAAFTTTLCQSRNISIITDACVAVTTGTVLFVKVDGSFSQLSNSASFVIDVSAPTPEGSITTPVSLGGASGAPLPYAGVVDKTDSYYAIAVNSGVGSYQVRISGMYHDADVYVYNDKTFSTLLCSGNNFVFGKESCVPWITGTTIYVKVSGIDSMAGAAYVIEVKKLTAPAAQGSSTTPILFDMSDPNFHFPQTASVGNTTNGTTSYYAVTGLTASTATTPSSYFISLAALSEDADLSIYQDATFTAAPVCTSAAAGTATESCTVSIPSNSSTLYIKVETYIPTTINGTYFNLLVE